MYWTQVLVVKSLDTPLYNCFSSPRGKWVHVRAELFLLIDLAWCATYLAVQAVNSFQGNEINGPVTRSIYIHMPQCQNCQVPVLQKRSLLV